MNVSEFAPRRFRPAETRQSPVAPTVEPAIRFDQDGRQMSHTSFQRPNFKEAFWDVVKTLPRDQQVSLAANALASQLQQTGDSQENREFIKSFTTRFSDEEKAVLKQSLEKHPLLENVSARKQGEFQFLLDRLWNDAGFQDAQKRPPVDLPKSLTDPNDIFFKNTRNGDWGRNRVMALLM